MAERLNNDFQFLDVPRPDALDAARHVVSTSAGSPSPGLRPPSPIKGEGKQVLSP